MLNTTSAPTLSEIVKSINVQIGDQGHFAKFKRMYRNDRIAFVYDCIPDYAKSITPYQEEILGYFDNGDRRVAVRGPHGLGKTFIASIMVHHSVLTAETDCKVPTTASAFRQLEKYLWPEIKKAASKLDWSAIGRSAYKAVAGASNELHSMSIRLNNGLVEAFAVASDNYALIEGAHATRLVYVFDEAKTIPAGMWDAAEGAFSTEGITEASECIALAISTPGEPSGRFYDIHMQKEGYKDWHVRHVTLDECIRAGRISHEWARNRAKQWGESSSTYQNRVLGEFADETEEGVIPLSWVRAAVARWQAWDKAGRLIPDGKRVLGVDTARFGEDKTVIATRYASLISDIATFQKVATTSTAGQVKARAKGHAIHIEMDGGLGASVYDMLKEQNVKGLVPITTGAKTTRKDRSKQMGFQNVRAAMWWNMRELLDPEYGSDIMLPPILDLITDLATPKWTMGSDAVVILESKKLIRDRIGRSTDMGDAVCLAFWNSGTGGGIVV